MSISNSYPQQRATLNLDFANSGKLDSRLSYSRSSTGSFMSNEKHLSSLNLTSNSEDFTAWTESNATASANTTASPDGSTTADTLTGNAGTSVKYLQSNTIPASDPVISVYAKAGTHSYIQITDNALATEFANFDLTSGTVGTVGADATAAIQAVGSTGWYRCIMRVTQTSTAFAWRVVMIDSSTAARQSTTSSTGTVQLWGGMMTELGDLTNVVAYQSSGSQIHREFAPTLKTSQSDQPRFEYSAADGQSVGLKIESSATNLCPQSSDFTDSGYILARATIDANCAVAPDGTLTADRLVEDGTATDSHQIARGISTGLSVGTSKYTLSIYAKASGRSRLAIKDNNQTTTGASTFDLSAGTVVSGTGAIEGVGNGWYRLSIFPTVDNSATAIPYIQLDDGSGTSYTGDSYSGVLVWGFQLETESGSAASSLISTSGASATRSADSCSVATSSFYTGGDVSIFAEVTDAKGDYATVARLRNTTTDDGLVLYKSNANSASSANLDYRSYDGGLKTNFSITGSGGATKVAIVAETNRFAGVADGGTVAENLSGSVPAGLDTLSIGSKDTQYTLNGTIKRLALYNVALSDTELQSLTS